MDSYPQSSALTFTTTDIGIDNDLSTVVEITKLSFPNNEILRIMKTKTVVEAENGFLGQNTIAYLRRGKRVAAAARSDRCTCVLQLSLVERLTRSAE